MGATSPVSLLAPIPARALAPSKMPGQQSRIARPALAGFGAEEGRQVPLNPMGHPAGGVALILQIDLYSQVRTALKFRCPRLRLQLLEDMQDPPPGGKPVTCLRQETGSVGSGLPLEARRQQVVLALEQLVHRALGHPPAALHNASTPIVTPSRQASVAAASNSRRPVTDCLRLRHAGTAVSPGFLDGDAVLPPGASRSAGPEDHRPRTHGMSAATRRSRAAAVRPSDGRTRPADRGIDLSSAGDGTGSQLLLGLATGNRSVYGT